MKLLLSGPIEGHLVAFYKRIAEEKAHWVVCAGDYGIHPDPQRLDKAARKYAGTDFSKMYVGAVMAPSVPTLTVAGVHDDHEWLQRRVNTNNTEVLANVHYLHQGFRTEIGWNEIIRVTGLGKVYSDATYRGEPSEKSYRHYTRREVERACSTGPTDLLVIYEHLDCPGIRNVIYATRPKLILTVTHNNRIVHPTVQGIPVISLGRQESKNVEWCNGSFVQQ